jgi:hypothetical protein
MEKSRNDKVFNHHHHPGAVANLLICCSRPIAHVIDFDNGNFSLSHMHTHTHIMAMTRSELEMTCRFIQRKHMDRVSWFVWLAFEEELQKEEKFCLLIDFYCFVIVECSSVLVAARK